MQPESVFQILKVAFKNLFCFRNQIKRSGNKQWFSGAPCPSKRTGQYIIKIRIRFKFNIGTALEGSLKGLCCMTDIAFFYVARSGNGYF